MEKDYKIVENQNIYDVANILLGGFDNIYVGLIQPNDVISSINFDLNTIATKNIIYDDIYYSSSTLQLQLNIANTTSIVEKIGLENQSIYDVVLMNYGGLNNIYKFIQDNDLISINELNVSFKSVIFDKNVVENLSLTKSIKSKGYIFGTLLKKHGRIRITQNNKIRITQDGKIRVVN